MTVDVDPSVGRIGALRPSNVRTVVSDFELNENLFMEKMMKAEVSDLQRPSRRELVKTVAAAGALAAALGPLGRGARAQRRSPHVIIVGAGLAGLCAAYNLQKQGCTYTILEAEKEHVGGRVRTCYFGDGLYGELGAMRIPSQHKVTLSYVNEFKLQSRAFVNDLAYYFMRGRRVRKDKNNKYVAILSALYQLQNGERDRSPDDLWGQTVSRQVDGLTVQEGTELLQANSFSTKKFRDFDRMSLRQLIDLSGLSEEAIEYLLVGSGGNQTLQHIASTEFLREEYTQIWSTPDNFSEIVGGTTLLPKAFLGSLQNKPRMGCQVVHLEQDREKKTTTVGYIADNTFGQASGDFVLCTMPYSVLARLDLPFSGAKRRAIQQIWYESSTKILVPTSTRFWETQAEPIFGGCTYTDLMTGVIQYPSDNPKGQNPEKSKGPGVLLLSYSWGQDARRLGAMAKSDRERLAVELVKKVHPELGNPGVVLWDQVRSWSWDNYRWAGGAFAFYLPGQFSDLHTDVIAPEGRIYFAGEHCSLAQTWMQGALVSAESAVTAMLTEWNKG